MPDIPLKITGIDLGDLSKPATKLIQTVGKFIGVVYEPQHIRRRAKAEADAARILAVAQVDTDRILAEGRLELQEDLQQKALRASERISNRELRRQANIEAVVCRALHQLPDSVGKEAVEEDWIAEFFNVCQDVSNGEMQTIWARLLAGEVTEPGTYSRRTLYFVRLLSPFDAAIFQNICNYIWHTSELLNKKVL